MRTRRRVGLAAVAATLLAVAIATSCSSQPASTRSKAAGQVPATSTGGGQSGQSAPTSPPVSWCEKGFTDPYTSAPAGATIVPAGDNSKVDFSIPHATYWFAPGTHTIGSGPYDQIKPASGDTYMGAPGAVLDGQNVNDFAFEGTYNDTSDQSVTIEYLTIQHFSPGQGAGAVNGNGNNGWTEKYDLMQDNSPGAAMMLGGDNVVADNCLTNNGEYGFNGYSYVDDTYLTSSFTGGALHIRMTGNEISWNDTYGWDGSNHALECGCAGGGKFWQDGDVTVTGNYVHDNHIGPGLWMDTDNAGFLVRGNYISGNGGEGLMYEVSYNALIEDNTFVDNADYAGPRIAGFPTGAIYVSESGGDNRIPSIEAGQLTITANVFNDNWGGVVIWQNANRYCGDGLDKCPLVPPPGETLFDWVNHGQATCKANLSQRSPVDYNALCHWRSQYVTVSHNVFTFNPADAAFAGRCTQKNSCGQSGLFSGYSSTSAYPAWSVCNAVSNLQGDVFADNAYRGGWKFVYFNQGDIATPAQWQAGRANVQGSGFNFRGQDAGSTFN